MPSQKSQDMSFGVEFAQGSRANGRIIGKKMQGAQANVTVSVG
jgi:hypothetical protein